MLAARWRDGASDFATYSYSSLRKTGLWGGLRGTWGMTHSLSQEKYVLRRVRERGAVSLGNGQGLFPWGNMIWVRTNTHN